MKKHLPLLMILALFLLLAIASWSTASAREAGGSSQAAADVQVLYVKPGGSGSCASWADACELQTALLAAGPGCEIWVQAGVYRPTTGTTRTVSFALESGVALYGGFAGSETLREQRDWETNVTTLSGDIGVAEDSSDNSYHVVVALYGVDATAILDGFTVRGGNADGEINDAYGGGLFNHTSSPSVSNVIFTANTAMFGGGMGSMVVSSPALINVTFSANSASGGGGMYSDGGSPTLTGVTFSGNTSYSGGGMYIYQTNNPTLTNVIFSGNSAEDSGGGLFNDSHSLTLTNVTFNNNSATAGGGLYNEFSAAILTNVTFSGNYASLNGGGMFNITASTPTLNNTIVWGNIPLENQVYDSITSIPIVHYSNIQGGCPSYATCDHVTNVEPQFVRLPSPGADATWGTSDDDTGDLRLQLTSPAIDAGDNAALPAGITTDLLGAPRFVDIPTIPDTGVGIPPIVDLGAYEAQKFVVVYLSLLVK